MVTAVIASAGEKGDGGRRGAAGQSVAVEPGPLEGTWEGHLVGDNARQRITISVVGESLHFHRDTNFWFETTFRLPAGKDPGQLHATIKGCAPSEAEFIGKVVRAFFEIKEGTLTLATMDEDAEETRKGFESAGTRYELRRREARRKGNQTGKAE